MKRIAIAIAAGLLLAMTTGCVVEPVRPVGATVYVEPTYESPGPGWVWEYHARYGWGWHHPYYGWHRGWR